MSIILSELTFPETNPISLTAFLEWLAHISRSGPWDSSIKYWSK